MDNDNLKEIHSDITDIYQSLLWIIAWNTLLTLSLIGFAISYYTENNVEIKNEENHTSREYVIRGN